MLSKAVNRRNQVFVGVGLQDVAAGASLQHVACELLRLVHRQHQHFRVRGVFQDLARGIEAVQPGKAQIHHDDVGPEAPALLDRVAAGRSFAAYLPAFLAFEQRSHAPPHDRVIVDDEDSQRHQPAASDITLHRSRPQSTWRNT